MKGQTPFSGVEIRDSHVGGWNSLINKQQLYAENASDPGALRHVIKPAYRSMFELLSGQARAVAAPALETTPLLAETAEGYQFLPASEVLFAGTPGIKERSGLAGRVPIFVLEAEPAAEAPLVRLHAAWALGRIGGTAARAALARAATRERDPQVHDEIRLSLSETAA